MSPPAFATIGYTVDVGQRNACDAIASMAQDLQTNPVEGALLAMGWSAPINDVTIVSADGLTVRRMITFATPPAFPSGQFPYPTEETLIGCLSNLYTGQLAAYCGKPVTELAPVLFDDPVTIFANAASPSGSDMLAWWTSVAFGSALAGIPDRAPPANTPWSSTNGLSGAGVDLDQAVAADQLSLGPADPLLALALPVIPDAIDGGFMVNGVAFAALAQPWNVAVIGHTNPGANGQWCGGNGGTCELSQGVGIAGFSTNGGVDTLVVPAPDDKAQLLMAPRTASIPSSMMKGPRQQSRRAQAGPGTPTNLSVFGNVGGGAKMDGQGTDVILGASGRAWSAAQKTALFAYAQGRYGVGYGAGF